MWIFSKASHLVVVFCAIFLCTSSASLLAAEIRGKVTILKKGGKRPLRNYSNAVVYLDGLQLAAPKQALRLEQRGKRFVPRILPVVKGQEVHFWNLDRVQHNVFSTDAKKRFDLGRYPKGEFRSIRFDQLGMHKIYCNIHQQMVADILVLDNPYYAVTDLAGRYRIVNVPEGRYRLRAEHIFGGHGEQEIVITNEALRADFRLISTKVVREVDEHPNKHGEAYRKKEDDYYADDWN